MSKDKNKEKMKALYRKNLSGLILQETLEKDSSLPSKKPMKSTQTGNRKVTKVLTHPKFL
jgi:hypothetical protein